MTEDAAYFDRALRRLDRFAWFFAAVAVIIVAVAADWREGLGTAGGAAFSLASFRNWKGVAAALGGERRARPGWGLILRFGILAACLLVIISYFGVSAWSILAGLFVSVAAVVAEIIYELLFHS